MPKTLNDLFQDTIQDIYSSETLLLQAMPQLRDAAQDPELKAAIEQHMTETQQQVQRVQQVAQMAGFSVEGKTCQATVGLVKEAQEHLQEFGGSPAGDAAIIACAQKNEHYEIANYGTVVAWAQQLGYDEAAQLLQQTLTEEENTDRVLTQIAESGDNQRAMANNGPKTGEQSSASLQ